MERENKNKALEILVVEDGKENMINAKESYQPFINEGLIRVNYAENCEDTIKYIDKADALISDLYFPGKDAKKIMREFLEKYPTKNHEKIRQGNDEAKVTIDDVRDSNGYLPLGFALSRKFLDNSKPAIIVSNAFCGHGGQNTNYEAVSSVGSNVGYAWYPVSDPSNYGAFLSLALIMPHGKEWRQKKEIVKKELGWQTALGAIASATQKQDLYEKIEKILPKELENPKRPNPINTNEWVPKWGNDFREKYIQKLKGGQK